MPNAKGKTVQKNTLEDFINDFNKTEIQTDIQKPSFNTPNDVNICLCSSNEYTPFIGVTIRSIVCNAGKDNNYDIYILSDDMTLENRWRIENIAAGHANISICIVNIASIVNKLTFYTWAHFTPKTYYRLLIPDLFIYFDKVIYLDSDTVINRDIAELFKIDIGNNILGCCYDTHVVSYCTRKPPLEQLEYNKKVLKLKQPKAYFQTGITVFNVKRFREDYEKGYLINQSQLLKFRWLDQDIINYLFQGKIFRLPNKWNVMIANEAPLLDEYYLPKTLRKEYYEARNDPYIVHYVGRGMPCYAKDPDLYEYFWKYARQTVFYEILLLRMCNETVCSTEDPRMKQLICAVEEIQLWLFCHTFKGRMRRLIISIVNLLCPIGTRRRNKIRLYKDRIHMARLPKAQ